ncbi:MAG: hypothetical protein JST87_04015 [Bacteroidetes bacterium]|nr:hypothetical protein [Bacteroidota bacterium]
MKFCYILVPVFLLALISCSKNNDGKPTIKLTSIGPGVVSRSDIFSVNFDFTEEGSSVIDSFFIIEHRLNAKQAGTVNEFVYLSYPVPPYTSVNKGQFSLSFVRYTPGPTNYGYLPDPPQFAGENDTSRFSFYIKDSRNKTSDTVTASSNVIILND